MKTKNSNEFLMNLDNVGLFNKIDPKGMLEEIQGLPNQLARAWKTADGYPLPVENEFSSVIIAGMGGSAIGADLLVSYIAPECRIPVSVLRGYHLPSWARGREILVVCSSHSGNTEETLSVFGEAVANQCTVMGISRGGQLLESAAENNLVGWKFDHNGQPRSAVGFSFGMLLNLFSRLELIPDQTSILNSTVSVMREHIKGIDADVPVSHNLAKRIAGQAMNRYLVILGAEHLEPIARRWKTQINELAKCWAQFEFLPEADHNTLAGLVFPEANLQNTYALFLDSKNYHPRNHKRMELTFSEFMLAGLCTDKVNTPDNSTLCEIWKMLLLGDFVSYYLAMAYQIDPTPIDALENFKKAMLN
ncbi:MAG: bifunctional phosphoglucose/phosphomannose isomerase [Pelolinea sp.]|nr:bifunctional phosphoglucose/phosphomannose isomerase [Pelolinea sp.]